jgi:hypothetical protein
MSTNIYDPKNYSVQINLMFYLILCHKHWSIISVLSIYAVKLKKCFDSVQP